MIGKVTGRIDHIGPDYALVEAGGVGYVVHVSDRTRAALPGPGAVTALYTELVVREDAFLLFGFLTLAEKEWHRLLTSVQGIGAKGAMAILGTLGAEGVGRAITLGDVTAIKAAPGIGPKTAARVVMELRDKAASVMALGAQGSAAAMVSGTPETPPALPAAPQDAAMAAPPASRAGAEADALSALVNLGYGHADAAEAVARAAAEGADDTPTLIRAALRRLAPGG